MKKKIWEIYRFFLCSVIGSGLTLGEQRKIMDKAGLDCSGLTAFDIHEYIIDEVQKESPFAKRVEKALNTKFRKAINIYSQYSAEEWIQELKDKGYSSNIGETAWISATCIDLDYTEAMNIFGELHIAAHESVHNLETVEKRVENLQSQIDELEKKHLKATTKLNEERKISKKLKSNLENLQNCQKRERAFCEITPLRESNTNKWKIKYEKTKDLIYNLQEEKKSQNRIIGELSKELEALKSHVKTIHNVQCSTDCTNCNSLNRRPHCCAKKVLMVGGLEKFRNHYQEIASGLNCFMEYHNGHCRDGEIDLSNKIGRCDFVLCPVDINSHAACLAVKKYCKKMDKDFFILNSSSISSVRRALENSLSEIS